jgi:hypothetical protein
MSVPAQQSLAPAMFVVGSVAASATTGALIAIGRRLGNAGLPFASMGAALLHRTTSSAETGLVLAGVGLHLFSTICWALIFVWLVRRMRWRLSAAAFAVTLAVFVAHWIGAWSTGSGLASVLPLGDRLVLAIVFAGSLVVGMRLAFLPSQSA